MLLTCPSVLAEFPLCGKPVSAEPTGCGHINRTYLVKTDAGKEYLLQSINTNVFPDVDRLMDNICLVTAHLREKILAAGGDPERETLTVVSAKDGQSFVRDRDGCWRVYLYIGDAVTLQSAGKPEVFYKAAKAFGRFQSQLEDFPAEKLFPVIPDFHNTPKRLRDLWAAVEADPLGRVKEVLPEITFFKEREAFAATLENAGLPLRVTHNDTKLNNLLFDGATMEPLCVIDLDTIMPGSSLYDFGDCIRFGAATAAEDEKDLSKVTCDLALFEAFTKGWLEACGAAMTDAEKRLLPESARILTLECGSRFLADYILGDTYFAIQRPGQNLDRARTQIKLVQDMEAKEAKMRAIVEKYEK